MTPDEQPQPVASELLPCPFCGEHPMSEQDEDELAVWCYQDHAMIQMTAQEWNTRTHPPTPAASQPDAVRVTDVAWLPDYWRQTASEFDGLGSVVSGSAYRKCADALEAALNPPAESSDVSTPRPADCEAIRSGEVTVLARDAVRVTRRYVRDLINELRIESVYWHQVCGSRHPDLLTRAASFIESSILNPPAESSARGDVK